MILPIILFLILLIAPDVYLWLHLIEPMKTWWISTIWFVPTALSLLSFFMARAGFYHNTFMRIMFAFILIFALPKIIFILLDFFVMWQIALGAALMVDLIFLYGFFFGWRRIIVRETVCESDLLPDSFNGYRILQFSDLHVGTYIQNPKFIKKLVRIMNEQQADLVVFTGDLVNIHAEEVLPFMSVLRTIKAKDGVFSIMGNHDYCEYGMDAAHEKKQKETEPIKESTAHRHQRILEYLEERMGWKMLMNEHVTIVRKNNAKEENKEEKIDLIGVENIGKPPFKSMGNLPKAMKGLEEGTFKILLSHDPTHWRQGVLHKTDIALTLSGHTHAGQLRIGKFSPAKWAYNEWGGKYMEDGSMLHISPGIGGTVPFRIGAWPEINVITLRKKKE